jgi:hypothetical protein
MEYNAFQLPPSLENTMKPSAKKDEALQVSSPASGVSMPFNIEDGSMDGLAVHFQSPALKRRYWQERHQGTYQQLQKVALHADWIRTLLKEAQCPALARRFEQDMMQVQHLKGLYHRLETKEFEGLKPLERDMLQRFIQGQKTFQKSLENSLHYLKGLLLGDEKIREAQAQRVFQQWVAQCLKDHKTKGLSADLIQDVLTLKNYL